jgi:dihydroorotase
MATYDLIVRDGRLFDPGAGIDQRGDIAFKDGFIAGYGDDVSSADGGVEIDVGGAVVAPGFIDMHAHVYTGVCQLVVPIDEIAPTSGVTTVVSTGDAGSHTFPGFRKLIINNTRTRVLAFVHICSVGLAPWPVGEMINIDFADVEGAASTVIRNRDVCLGVKVRQSHEIVGDNGLEPLRLAVEAAGLSNSKVMVHIGGVPAPLPEVLELLRPGDIVTHCFTGREHGVLNEEGEILPEVRAARERGIYFDVAHGQASFDFTVAEAALEQDFLPDFISSDLHSGCVNGPAIDLPTTMSKFLNLGLPLEEVVQLTTTTPARILERTEELGTLKVGASGDVAVFDVIEEPWEFYDAAGNTRNWERRIQVRHTVRAGRLWGRPYPHPYVDI